MQFKKRYVVFFVIFYLLIIGTSFASIGEVVFKKRNCDYFIVETKMGYAILEWYGGTDPYEGDIVVGDFESFGFKDIYDLSLRSDIHVWVEDYWLSKEQALEKYFRLCY